MTIVRKTDGHRNGKKDFNIKKNILNYKKTIIMVKTIQVKNVPKTDDFSGIYFNKCSV